MNLVLEDASIFMEFPWLKLSVHLVLMKVVIDRLQSFSMEGNELIVQRAATISVHIPHGVDKSTARRFRELEPVLETEAEHARHQTSSSAEMSLTEIS